MNFSILINKIITFVILILVGYLCGKKNVVSKDFSKSASKLLITVFATASIINSVTGSKLDISGNELAFALLVTSILTVFLYLCGMIVGIVMGKTDTAAQYEMCISVVNNLFIGVPIIQAVYGNEAVLYIGLGCISYNIILYSYGVWRLKSSKGNGGFKLKEMMTLPLISALIALVIFIVKPQIPSLIVEMVSITSSATAPLSMIVIGTSLSTINPTLAFAELKSYVLSFVRLVIVPVITYFLFRTFVDNKVLLMTCVLVAGCPTAVVVTPLCLKYDYNPENSSKIIMVTTVLSMITMPLLIKIFG